MAIAYDDSSVASIVEYSRRLQGHTLREMVDVEHIPDISRRKGSFGNAVEKYYFGYEPNSDLRPDFPKVGLELKTTPLKRNRNGTFSAKERLVITMIDYNKVIHEDFEHSHLLEKSKNILLISYEWKPKTDPLDYKILLAALWGLPEEDMPQFKEDWENIVGKVRSGHAEDISSSDTMYLEACTKARDSSKRTSQPFSDVPAKPRAWALKASYMTAASNKLLVAMQPILRTGADKDVTLLDLVRIRFAPYIGRTQDELADAFGIGTREHRPKNANALITRRILGVDPASRIEEFEKAGITPKTVRLKRNGHPKESVSFASFKYADLAERDFEDSDFYGYLQQKYLFVIYEEGSDGLYRLADVCFWQMPDSDIPEAKRCYDQMRQNVLDGRADLSVKSTENRCCHVRTHGHNAQDRYPQPFGEPVPKKSFWLNQKYLTEEIAKARFL